MAGQWGPYPGRVLDVHDGDTVVMDVDLGFGVMLMGRTWGGRTQLACRVFGINAPELNTAEGKAARDFARGLLGPGDRVLTVSHKWDKYGGRFDGDITLPDGRDFATVMTGAGHAVPVDW